MGMSGVMHYRIEYTDSNGVIHRVGWESRLYGKPCEMNFRAYCTKKGLTAATMIDQRSRLVAYELTPEGCKAVCPPNQVKATKRQNGEYMVTCTPKIHIGRELCIVHCAHLLNNLTVGSDRQLPTSGKKLIEGALNDRLYHGVNNIHDDEDNWLTPELRDWDYAYAENHVRKLIPAFFK